MPKTLVERYEQLLSQDPGSTLFVELAKALIEKGELPRAIEISQQGLEHHPRSVVGRVLWGKALILLGRPAEAMEQFDKAIGIDRENPYAYNLIAEVLLQKGLYRSALPILRKAVTLQPDDGRVKQWMDRAQAALAGGPAPTAEELINPTSPLRMLQDPDALSDSGQHPAVPDAPAAPQGPAPAKPAEAQQANEAEGAAPGDAPPAQPGPAAAPGSELGAGDDLFGDSPLPDAPAAAPRKAPRASGEKPAPAQSQGETAGPPVLTPVPESPEPPPAAEPKSEGVLGDVPPPAPEAAPAAEPKSAGLLGDIPSPPEDAPAPPPPEPKAAPPRPPPIRSSGQKRALLEDIPDLGQSAASVEIPKIELSSSSAKEIAAEYERELREKLSEKAAKKGFFARNAALVAVAAVVGVALLAAAGAFAWTRARHRGRDLQDALADAHHALALDTAKGYQDALASLATALEMDDGSADAWALEAYVHGILFAEHGGAAEHRQKVEEALSRPGVAERFQGLALAARYYAADSKSRDSARRSVLSATVDAPEVQELAGRILLGQKDTRGAVERFRKALELSSSNVRALVALGTYYQDAKDPQTALKFYETAAVVSPAHPERVIGAAECRVELGQDLDKAAEEMKALPASDELPPDLLARRELVQGRLLAATGHAKEGVALLTDAAKGSRSRAYDFHLALGEAAVAAGDYPAAQRAYEAALKVRATEAAKEGLARVLLGRDRPREVLARISAEADERRLALVRGIAYADLEEWAKARAELGRTQVGGKYPSEAVVYLALADAAQGEAAAAQSTLERALSATKKAKADLRVALGRVYWKQGQADKAREQFEAAAKEGRDYEAPCALGRLLLEQGDPDKALPALEQAVERNGSHGEARAALVRLYLMIGRLQEGLAGAQAWAADDPQAPGAQKLLALALHLSGSWKDADAASARAVKAAPQDAEAHRIRSMVLFSIGDARAAFSELERANKLDPKDPDTFCEIGHAFLRQGNGPHAEAAFSAALREQPSSDCGAIGAQLSRLPSGAKPAARALAERAEKSRAAWDRGQAYAALARAELATGAVAQAKKAAEQGVAVAPYLGNAHWALGLAAARQKDEEKAKAELRQAADLEPAHAGIRLAVADFLARSGDLEAAIKDYEIFLRLGGDREETSRVRKALPELKKRLGSR